MEDTIRQEPKIRALVKHSVKGQTYWAEITARGDTPKEVKELIEAVIKELKELCGNEGEIF